MDVPNQKPVWPSAAGPKVPDFHSKLRKKGNVDMDTALAWLRRELAAMQLQDRNMHKQLLAMRSSICNLKDELKNERERWEIELTQQEDRSDLKPAPGYVTKVEIIRDNNHREELKINHAKQDSGILTDEERSDSDELEESVQRLLKTFPPAVKPRSSSFSATAKHSNSYHGHAVKRTDESEDKESNKRNSRDDFRVRARSVAGTEIERLSSASFFLPRRSQTFVDGMVSRFGSMPVINEIPSDALERNTARSKTFAVYGYRHSGSVDDNTHRSSFSVPKNLPAFGSLTRHSSMPVMYSGGRPKSGIELRSKKENKRPVTSQPAIKRSTSQIILSRPALEKFKETESNQFKQYRMYRSTSQASLV